MARSLATIAACCVVVRAGQINNNKAMQDKSKKSHTSTNFYLVVAILITAICMSIGYVVSKHHVLQEMIEKNHIPDSELLHLLEKVKIFFAPVDRVLMPFESIISILFTLFLIEGGRKFVAIFLPKKTKDLIRGRKDDVSKKVTDWIKKWIQGFRKT